MISAMSEKSNEAKSNVISTEDTCDKLVADVKIVTDSHSTLLHNNKILSNELTQHRKIAAEQKEAWQRERTALIEQTEKSCMEIRFELEAKLNTMKEKMKNIYTEEINKSREKHEKQERELMQYKQTCQLLAEKIDKYVEHTRSISEQLWKVNDQNLNLIRENEFLKSKLRLAEGNPHESEIFQPTNLGKKYLDYQIRPNSKI